MRASDLRRFGFAAATAVFCFTALFVFAHGQAAADGQNRAGIVVTFGEGRTNALCVEFSEEEISGADLLQRAGFPVVTASGSGGAAVCDIGGIGCQAPGDCFCQCHGSGCQYWAYYTLEGGAWKYSAVGASTRTVHNGDVDGWAWGSGGIGSGAKPEARTFDEICPPPAEATPSSSSCVHSDHEAQSDAAFRQRDAAADAHLLRPNRHFSAGVGRPGQASDRDGALAPGRAKPEP